MKHMKLRQLLVLVVGFIALLVCGCDGELPRGLNRAKRPLTLIAKGSQGIVIGDADGKLYSYGDTYYFAQTIMASDLKQGNIIIGN